MIRRINNRNFLSIQYPPIHMWHASHHKKDFTRCDSETNYDHPITLCSDTKFVTTKKNPLEVTRLN